LNSNHNYIFKIKIMETKGSGKISRPLMMTGGKSNYIPIY